MYRNLLVPLDGSGLSEQALPHAKDLAKSSGGSMHLIRVLTSHPDADNPIGASLQADRSVGAAMEIGRQLQEARISAIQDYLEHHAFQPKNDGIEAQTEILEGSPEDNIVEYAKQHDIDLVVMSTSGQGGIKRLILGSTTDRVIRSCEVPVLVIPSG